MQTATSYNPALRIAPIARLEMMEPSLFHMLHSPFPKLRTSDGKLSGVKVYIAAHPSVAMDQIIQETANKA